VSVSVLDWRAWLRENRIGMELRRHLLDVLVDERNISIAAKWPNSRGLLVSVKVDRNFRSFHLISAETQLFSDDIVRK